MVRNLGTPWGGMGAYFYPQVDHIQVTQANINAFSEGLTKYGNYKKLPDHCWRYPVVDNWKDNEVPPLPPKQN